MDKPIDIILHCPRCATQHIDEPDLEAGWTNPPHKSHLCAACGHVWRPSDAHTNGVLRIATKGKNDSPRAVSGALSSSALQKAALRVRALLRAL